MGRTSRWLANFLGWKKSDSSASSNSKQKKWRFGKSYREGKQKGVQPSVQNVPAAEERRGSYREGLDGNEESKRAIAVAAATAAVAEAAVAAAHAAAEVVKLTSGGGGRSLRAGGGGKREEWAAVKIQAIFRGYLARRALRALKGLVRLQALARGNIVRKQVAETLRCMHALVRVQARARTCRALKNERTPLDKPPRSNGPRSQRSASVKRGYGRNPSVQVGDHGRSKSVGWNWLDQWIEEKYSDDEKNTKILEIDPGKPSNPKQTPKKHHHQNKTQFTMMTSSCSTLTQPESPSKDSTTEQLSIPSPSTIDMAESSYQISYEESPYYSVTSRPGSSKRGGYNTPAKSEYSSSYSIFGGGYTDYYPNYMTNTKSSSAKVRSHSAPKQRPAQFEKLGSVKKVVNSNLQLKFASKGYPGSGRLDRLGMPVGY
ncbi:hypothetical protein LUZ60_014687 [Juncus effusus]|nr:hypothetical protein LUZ60_014687 [Juncus effusus]